MSSVLKIIKEGASKRKTPGIPNRKLNAPVRNTSYKESLGIEIELEGTNLPTAGYLDAIVSSSGAAWSVKQDGSLRGGLEYVLSKPCDSGEVDYLVRGLFNVFEQRKTKLALSNRCSLHVHYNVGGLKVNSLTSVIALWTVFEEPLLRWWGDARYKNHFCLSSKDESANVKAWQSFLTDGRLPEETGLRYTALNLVAIKKYGSVEFRGGGGVDNPDKAIVWIRFLYALCEYAKAKYNNPQELAYDLSERGALTIFLDICGEEFETFGREVVTTVEEFDRCCAESFYNFQPILFGFPWADWLQEINKEYVPNPFENGQGKTKTRREPDPVVPQWVTTGPDRLVNAAAERPVRFTWPADAPQQAQRDVNLARAIQALRLDPTN